MWIRHVDRYLYTNIYIYISSSDNDEIAWVPYLRFVLNL